VDEAVSLKRRAIKLSVLVSVGLILALAQIPAQAQIRAASMEHQAAPRGAEFYRDILPSGRALFPNYPGSSPSQDKLRSPDGAFTFVMQTDGNLVLYGPTGQATWASWTQGQAVAYCWMQDDGNLVIYGWSHNPIWASGTQGQPGAFLRMQNDGNAVILQTNGINALWSAWAGRF
jgi:hypothetical protein